MEPIEQSLKKINNATSKANSVNSSNTEPPRPNLPGDPNCPICGGIGFVRQDLPITHPDFGRMQICTCRQAEVQRSAQTQLYRFSNLESLARMTFATFHEQGRLGLPDQQAESLRFAFNHAQQFAAQLNGWLLLMGNNGCGKTHLAAAIANQVVSLGIPTLFLTVPDLLDWLRFSYQAADTSFEQRFEEIRNVRLLVLDDFGTQNATPWAQEKLFQIINHRYLNRLPTVLTTNLNLDEIENRIRSRLNDPELVKAVLITAPDYRSPVNDQPDESISTLHLLNDRSFGNFSLREREELSEEQKRSLEKAFHACQQFAEKPTGWIVLMGRYGCGKTHLAAAIGNYRYGLGEKLVFVVVPDLLDHLRATFSPNSPTSYDRLFEQVRTAPLLILDDLGTQSATPWAREKLYQIFNYRYNARLPMVITTASTLDEIDERIRSRMLDGRLCSIYAILAPTY
ncbi:MAG: ATP-binding protein, partial [Longilinea sp.]|nr:ATP-binding protein [Longilinea sp.]